MLDKQLKGAKEIAKSLGRSTGTIMRMQREEELPIYLVGGIWEASEKDLEDWKEHRRMGKTYERKDKKGKK